MARRSKRPHRRVIFHQTSKDKTKFSIQPLLKTFCADSTMPTHRHIHSPHSEVPRSGEICWLAPMNMQVLSDRCLPRTLSCILSVNVDSSRIHPYSSLRWTAKIAHCRSHRRCKWCRRTIWHLQAPNGRACGKYHWEHSIFLVPRKCPIPRLAPDGCRVVGFSLNQACTK